MVHVQNARPAATTSQHHGTGHTLLAAAVGAHLVIVIPLSSADGMVFEATPELTYHNSFATTTRFGASASTVATGSNQYEIPAEPVPKETR